MLDRGPVSIINCSNIKLNFLKQAWKHKNNPKNPEKNP